MKYGAMLLVQGFIHSLEEWSDDKERACYTMDERWDYLLDFSKGIHFIDRTYACGEYDPVVKDRIERNEVELFFNTFDDLFEWIDRMHMCA